MAWSPAPHPPSAATPMCPSGPGDGRRMSEPCRVGLAAEPQQQPPRPHSTLCLPLPLPLGLKQELHPNQEVALEEVGEGEMLESKLVIPDEMLQYLNQVSASSPVKDVIRSSQSITWRSMSISIRGSLGDLRRHFVVKVKNMCQSWVMPRATESNVFCTFNRRSRTSRASRTRSPRSSRAATTTPTPQTPTTTTTTTTPACSSGPPSVRVRPRARARRTPQGACPVRERGCAWVLARASAVT